MRPIPNLLQHDNVLCIVIEFDTRRVLDPGRGSLFGVISETLPLSRTSPVNPPPLRLDWVGRPEQTNVRLNNGPGLVDIRDLWNQQTPFAIATEHRGISASGSRTVLPIRTCATTSRTGRQPH